MFRPDQRESGFQLEAMLGEDQLAATWKVTELSTGRPRVLRILTVTAKPFQERFVRSANAQLALVHPNLVQVLGVTEIGQRPAVVTEFVDGASLATWIAAGPHPVPRVLDLFAGLARGVGAAHAAGLLHRNLKPSKVLVRSSGGETVPKINDFTLGKVTAGEGQALTQVGMTFGTPHYMAPEQFRGVGDVDPRADLFALGALLYEMLAGRRPFEGAGLMELYASASTAGYAPLPSLRPDVPPEVVALVVALLAPEAAARPQSAAEVLERLPRPGGFTPLQPAGPTIVATGSPPSITEEGANPAATAPPAAARAAAASPAPPQSAALPGTRPSDAKTQESPSSRAHTLPPEVVFVEAKGAADERQLVRQIALAAVVALVFLVLIALLLSQL
jgi:serine/threonine protein kinase